MDRVHMELATVKCLSAVWLTGWSTGRRPRGRRRHRLTSRPICASNAPTNAKEIDMLIGGVVVAVVLGWLCWPLWSAKREEWQADNGPRGQAYERAREACVLILGVVLLVCAARVAGWLGLDELTASPARKARACDYACKVERAGPPVDGMRPLQ